MRQPRGLRRRDEVRLRDPAPPFVLLEVVERDQEGVRRGADPRGVAAAAAAAARGRRRTVRRRRSLARNRSDRGGLDPAREVPEHLRRRAPAGLGPPALPGGVPLLVPRHGVGEGLLRGRRRRGGRGPEVALDERGEGGADARELSQAREVVDPPRVGPRGAQGLAEDPGPVGGEERGGGAEGVVAASRWRRRKRKGRVVVVASVADDDIAAVVASLRGGARLVFSSVTCGFACLVVEQGPVNGN